MGFKARRSLDGQAAVGSIIWNFYTTDRAFYGS